MRLLQVRRQRRLASHLGGDGEVLEDVLRLVRRDDPADDLGGERSQGAGGRRSQDAPSQRVSAGFHQPREQRRQKHHEEGGPGGAAAGGGGGREGPAVEGRAPALRGGLHRRRPGRPGP